MTVGGEVLFDRAASACVASDRFRIKSRRYTQQYSHIYFSRLSTLRPHVLARCEAKWSRLDGRPKVLGRILDVSKGVLCVIVGTVYCDMPLKPNILDEVAAENCVLPPPPRPKYVSDKDEFVLEDETGRVKLVGDILREGWLTTGVVAGLLGMETANGEFHVTDICVPGLAPQAVPMDISTSEPKYLAFVSGLQLGSSKERSLQVSLLFDYLAGYLGGPEEQQFVSRICRLVMAGNSLVAPPPAESDRKSKKDAPHFSAEPLKELDGFMSQLCENMAIDIVPGDHDPANYTLPQQPIHRSIFPLSSRWNTFTPTTNPCLFHVDGIQCLGMAGQNVDDLYRFSVEDDRLALAEKTLLWRHMAPTAPDTLACYPYDDSDPFIIDECPHIYFVGNQKEFQTRLVKGDDGQTVRIVMIPTFADSGQLVLVNLQNLDAFTMTLHPVASSEGVN